VVRPAERYEIRPLWRSVADVGADVERRLAERGLVIEDYADFERDGKPGSIGFVGVVPADPGVRAIAYLAPRTPDDQRAQFAGWVEQKVDNYLECGPMRDGWEKRTSDDGWQLWAEPEDLLAPEADALPEGHPPI
jgi:hypothetical protein